MNREYQADLDFQGLTMSDPVSILDEYFLILKAWSFVNLFISLNPGIHCPFIVTVKDTYPQSISCTSTYSSLILIITFICHLHFLCFLIR